MKKDLNSTKSKASQGSPKKISTKGLSSIKKSKETSKIQSSTTATTENHNANGAFSHAASNRGK